MWRWSARRRPGSAPAQWPQPEQLVRTTLPPPVCQVRPAQTRPVGPSERFPRRRPRHPYRNARAARHRRTAISGRRPRHPSGRRMTEPHQTSGLRRRRRGAVRPRQVLCQGRTLGTWRPSWLAHPHSTRFLDGDTTERRRRSASIRQERRNLARSPSAAVIPCAKCALFDRRMTS